jgi:mandelate racemase
MRPVAAYDSNGLGLLDPQAAADEVLELVAEGFRAIKMRLGRPSGHDDLAALLRTPVLIGENFAGPRAMSAALAHDASDLVMADLERIGGASGWMAATALADAAGTEMSSHLYHEVSAHLLAATPAADWLEYVDWADPILEQLRRWPTAT